MTNSSIQSSPILADLKDINLIKRAHSGDAAAFELIVRNHNRGLFRAARGVLNDEEQAQEAVQEAYIKAFKNLSSYEGRASLKTWLTRIVVNQAISIKRKQHSDVLFDDNVIAFHSESEHKKTVTTMSEKLTPEAIASQQEMKCLLEAAIRRLPEGYRSVFMLRAVEGISVSDSAYCLDLTEDVIKKRLSRAKDMLRNDLVQQLENQAADTFEFAGKRCEAVTLFVMTELTRLGMVVSDKEA
ncbi:RNA polymerase sigma factor [Vibrio sp.]|uniref:RNA polymerase sigma factor n=1 Tax=Vibrio sp. TaxID=678 RepID=UPI003AA95954